jgi:hypothetical protein
MKGGERLRNVLDGVQRELTAGLADAEAELAQLDARRMELKSMIAKARAALGLESSSVVAATAAPTRLTLHEALAQVLRERANTWMSARHLADEVNARKLYAKRDGSAVEINQIHARVKNYPQLFEKDQSKIRLHKSAVDV